MNGLRAFLAFFRDFIVGDDLVVAIGVAAGLAITATLVHLGFNPWWLWPLLVAAVFAISLRRR
ncbi:hypothetical protein [Nocardia sp. NPDC020380]|uniref:hypothetical protein n=1 Tax=Nocardia sp. NPDC020380 TaxID=3364309 RepID=UPI00378B90ED